MSQNGVKISQINVIEDLEGFFALGVTEQGENGRVSLELIKDSAESASGAALAAYQAAGAAQSATITANNSALNADQKADAAESAAANAAAQALLAEEKAALADSAAATASTEASNANTATTNANTATSEANAAAIAANEAAGGVANGHVEEGDNRAVSGDEVYRYNFPLNKAINGERAVYKETGDIFSSHPGVIVDRDTNYVRYQLTAPPGNRWLIAGPFEPTRERKVIVEFDLEFIEHPATKGIVISVAAGASPSTPYATIKPNTVESGHYAVEFNPSDYTSAMGYSEYYIWINNSTLSSGELMDLFIRNFTIYETERAVDFENIGGENAEELFQSIDEILKLGGKIEPDDPAFVTGGVVHNYLENDFGITTNLLPSLAGYGRGKSFTFLAGTTAYGERVGVNLPANFSSRFSVEIRASAPFPFASSLFWQEFGTPNNIVPSKVISWTSDGDEYVYLTTLEGSSGVVSSLFWFTANTTPLASDITISMVAVSVVETVKEKVQELNSEAGQEREALEIEWKNYSKKTPIKVKKDGTGDFTTIQEAINSVTDASVIKQYDVQVFDDYEITDLTNLHFVNTPSQKVTNPSAINQNVALFVTKDFVHVRGMGDQRRLEIISPIDLPGSVYQYIQVLYTKGACEVNNFNLVITGGRYATHQESGGLDTHPDYHAKTVYRNIRMEHKGNAGYPTTWASVCAQANGTSAGSVQVYENCKWISPFARPFYVHSNKNFDSGNEFLFRNCEVEYTGNNAINTVSVGLEDIGPGQSSIITVIGCKFPEFGTTINIRGTEQYISQEANRWTNAIAKLTGHSNAPALPAAQISGGLVFRTVSVADSIEVVGGSAKDLIFGRNWLKRPGGTLVGETWGDIFVRDIQAHLGGSYIFSLAHRLGNCAAENKSLILNIGGVDHTVVFAQNYVTAGGEAYVWNTTPAIADTAIIASINSQLSGLATVAVNNAYKFETYNDCKETGRVTAAIDRLKLIRRDFSIRYNGWRLCQAGEKPEGITAERIHNNGTIFLLPKVLIPGNYLGLSATKGTFWKAGANGAIVSAGEADAFFIAIDSNVLKIIS